MKKDDDDEGGLSFTHEGLVLLGNLFGAYLVPRPTTTQEVMYAAHSLLNSIREGMKTAFGYCEVHELIKYPCAYCGIPIGCQGCHKVQCPCNNEEKTSGFLWRYILMHMVVLALIPSPPKETTH